MNTPKPRISRLLTVGAAGAVAGTAVSAAIYGIARAASVTYVVSKPGSATKLIHLHDVVSLSLMSFALGLAAVVVATRLRRPSLRAMQILGATLAVASTSMDVSIHATAAAKLTLAAMHIVVGVAYVASLRAMESAPTTSAADTDDVVPVLVPVAA